MNLESLANELLLDIFDKLNTLHLYSAFYALNARFNTLLHVHCRVCHLDFRSASKYDFDMMCEQHLPLIIDRVVSLHLAHSDETPNLPDLFVSHYFTMNQFMHLKLLGLYDLRSSGTSMNIISKCRHLPYLTHLTITGYGFWDMIDFVSFIDNIWHLPNLINCNLSGTILLTRRFTGLTVISTSIESLEMKSISFSPSELAHLIEHTPRLRHLSANVKSTLNAQLKLPPVLLITSMKLHLDNSLHVLVNLLQHSPNLCHLTLENENSFWNGHQWENIIIGNGLQLKVFRLKMMFDFVNADQLDEQVDELLNTFRTPFWLDEHRWFVRCDFRPSNSIQHSYLYTLPCAFKIVHTSSIRSKWTCPNIQDYCSYDQVDTISLGEDFFRHSMTIFPIRFHNLRHLDIRPSFNTAFWLIIPTVNQLTSLHLYDCEKHDCSQVQTLLNRASHLYSLKLTGSSGLQSILFRLISRSIRRLDLLPDNVYPTIYFSTRQCISLTRSPLGQQCEVLRIGVKNPVTILDLVNTSIHLRIIIFRCENDKWNGRQEITGRNDELIKWYKERLSSSCSIFRDMETNFVHIWIRH